MFDNCLYCGAPLTGHSKYYGECDACYSDYMCTYKYGGYRASAKFAEGKPRFAHWRIFQMSVPRLASYLSKFLSGKFSTVITAKGNEYVYAEGEVPILLVAHMDTVHKDLPRVQQDLQQNVLWSKTGLGADDRAGIAAIIELLDQGYRPHVLFTDKEESGGAGAYAFTRDFKEIDVNCIIELDRRGSDDAVYYNCDNKDFEEYITSFGFKTSYGSFTDISKICPYFGIAGANLSIGYYFAHSDSEYLKVDEWEKTVRRVENILLNPPTVRYEYVPKYSYGYHGYSKSYTWTYDDYTSKKSEVTTDDLTYDDGAYADIETISACAGDVSVNVDIMELVYSFGGTLVDWQEFLADNKGKIESALREKILDTVYNLCISSMPDFLLK